VWASQAHRTGPRCQRTPDGTVSTTFPPPPSPGQVCVPPHPATTRARAGEPHLPRRHLPLVTPLPSRTIYQLCTVGPRSSTRAHTPGHSSCMLSPGFSRAVCHGHHVPLLQRLHRRQGARSRRCARHPGPTGLKDGAEFRATTMGPVSGHHFGRDLRAGPLIGTCPRRHSAVSPWISLAACGCGLAEPCTTSRRWSLRCAGTAGRSRHRQARDQSAAACRSIAILIIPLSSPLGARLAW